jgi:hypothetical protein
MLGRLAKRHRAIRYKLSALTRAEFIPSAASGGFSLLSLPQLSVNNQRTIPKGDKSKGNKVHRTLSVNQFVLLGC